MAKKPKILIVKYLYPKNFKDRLKKDAREAGVEIDFALWNDIVIDTAATQSENIISIGNKRLGSYDAVYVRSIMDRYYEFTQLVNIASHLGIPVVDRNLSRGNRVNDLKIQQTTQAVFHGILVPRTVYASGATLVRESDRFGSWPLILKVMGIHRGEGVFIVKNKEEISKIIDKYIKTTEFKNFLLQEVIDYAADYRVFVVGNKVLGAIQRIPGKGEFRANVARGGSAKAIKNVPEKLAHLATKTTKILDLDIAGVDFMEDKHGNYYLTEVNRAPGYRGFESATGINVQVEILKYIKGLILSSSAD